MGAKDPGLELVYARQVREFHGHVRWNRSREVADTLKARPHILSQADPVSFYFRRNVSTNMIERYDSLMELRFRHFLLFICPHPPFKIRKHPFDTPHSASYLLPISPSQHLNCTGHGQHRIAHCHSKRVAGICVGVFAALRSETSHLLLYFASGASGLV